MPYIGKALSARIPNSELKCIQNGGHMLPITHPEICAQIVSEIIEP
jgi:pimeloyl-ACP methyl ester carboxylesterase